MVRTPAFLYICHPARAVWHLASGWLLLLLLAGSGLKHYQYCDPMFLTTTAIVSDTSNVPQDDIGNHFGLRILTAGLRYSLESSFGECGHIVVPP